MGVDTRDRPSRRELLRILAASSAASVAGTCPVLARLAAIQPCADAAAAGTLLGTLPLTRAGAPVQPFGVKFGGRGLDARLITDLSLLEPGRLITPNPLAYIRTECPPDVAADRRPWTINVSGVVERSQVLSLDELIREARPMGAHLFECAGNNNPANFGLMSVAEWDGVPLAPIVSRLKPGAECDGRARERQGLQRRTVGRFIPGASWVLPLASLERLGAFLAVRMNGEALPVDHGKPVRLVVPGWYGCAWIKWVARASARWRTGGGDGPDERVRGPNAPGGSTRSRNRLHATRDPGGGHACSRREAARFEANSNIVSSGWSGVAAKPLHRLAIRFGVDDSWNRFPSVRFPRRTRSGRSGNTAGGRLHQGYTASA